MGRPVRVEPVARLESGGGGRSGGHGGGDGASALLQIVPGGRSGGVVGGQSGRMSGVGRVAGDSAGVREQIAVGQAHRQERIDRVVLLLRLLLLLLLPDLAPHVVLAGSCSGVLEIPISQAWRFFKK